MKKGLLTKHAGLLAVLLVFAILAVAYNISLPLFEAPDEGAHFNYVNWFAEGHGLPNLRDDEWRIGHEIGQPPLYYAVLGALVAPIERADKDIIAPANPNWPLGDGVTVFYHTESENFPYRDTALALHLARFVSTLLGLVTITATYMMAAHIAPKQALLAATIVAFNPQFIFISSAVTNDAMVAATSALALLLVVRLVIQPRPAFWPCAALGILWGLASLSKASGLAIGVPIGLGLFLVAWQSRSWRIFVLSAAGVLTGFTLTAGWWFVRNWRLYDDPLAWEELLYANRFMVRETVLSGPETIQYAGHLLKSYWAMFGYGILAPEWFYIAVNIIALAGLVGFVLWFLRRPAGEEARTRRLATLVLVVWTVIVGILLMRWMSQLLYTNQGRLLYPAVSSLAVLIAIGYATFARMKKWLNGAVSLFLVAWSIAALLLVVRPAYDRPRPLNQEVIVPNPTTISFDGQMGLIGYEVIQSPVEAGHPLEVDLYWRALAPMTESFVVALQAVDADGSVVAESVSVPHEGRFQTPTWTSEKIYRDRLTLSDVQAKARPGLARLVLSVHPFGRTGEWLPVWVDGTAAGDEVMLTTIKIKPSDETLYSPEHRANVTFGEMAQLSGFDVPLEANAGQSIEVKLYWQALNPDGEDYKVFVHLLDEYGRLVAQSDSYPQDGWYPTSIWAAGEQIWDDYTIFLPDETLAGRYHIAVGLYHPVSGKRLPARGVDGVHLYNDSAVLATIVVGGL